MFDTDLIITLVWFRWVFGREPAWLWPWMQTHKQDYYLLLRPDIAWEADRARYNEDRREELYEAYREIIVALKVPFSQIDGIGDKRLTNALEALSYKTIQV